MMKKSAGMCHRYLTAELLQAASKAFEAIILYIDG